MAGVPGREEDADVRAVGSLWWCADCMMGVDDNVCCMTVCCMDGTAFNVSILDCG